MKKFFKALAVIASLAILGGAFVSCSDDDDDDEPAKYTVSFETNGGSTVENQTVEKGKKVTKPTDPTKDGNLFSGWFKESELTNAWDFDTDTVTKNTTLYAKWEEIADNESVVTFNSNGGSTVDSVKVENGGKLTKPEDPAKDNAVFAGWYKEESLENAWDFDDDTVDESITLYAKWTQKFTVSFNVNGGTGEIAAQTVLDGSKASAPETNPTKTGYTFKGWFTSTDNGTTLSETAFDFDTAITASVTLYAKWEKNKYSVTYAAGTHGDDAVTLADESSLPETKEVEYGSTVTVGAAVSATGDLTFKGWSNGLGTTYQPGETFTMPDKAVTLNAVWASADEVTVTFHANKPSTASESNAVNGTMSPQTIKKNTATALTENAFSLTGYTFAGWATSETGNVDKADKAEVSLAEDTDYYAVWTAKKSGWCYEMYAGTRKRPKFM